MEQSLFDKYGGIPVVTVIIRDFYKRVLRRPNLRRYFEGVSVEDLIQHQIAFVSMALGKMPHNYVGRSMKEAHRGVGVSGASFDLVVELLADVMRDNEVSPDDLITIVANVKSYRKDIVEK